MTVLQRIPLPAMITVLKILIANNYEILLKNYANIIINIEYSTASLQQITSAPVYKLAVIEKAVQLQRNHHSIICLDVAPQRFSVSNILYWIQKNLSFHMKILIKKQDVLMVLFPSLYRACFSPKMKTKMCQLNFANKSVMQSRKN
ncbi:hypothetical protein T08_8442 [Trichinella sp. T8]|nr:hypothetical protein T08_8442 [Trichinella sp. T8]